MSYNVNFLQELEETLKRNGKNLRDIEWVGVVDSIDTSLIDKECCFLSNKPIVGYFDIDTFISKADFEYDNYYGSHEIRADLVVVGDNWWLERHEYDGAEWWEYKTMPKKPSITRAVSFLTEDFRDECKDMDE